MIKPKSVLRISLNHLNDKMIGKKEYADYLYNGDAKLFFDAEPYRTETYAIALLHYGKLAITRDLTTALIKGPTILCMGPSVTRQWEKIDPDYLMEVVFFRKEFLLSINIDVNFIERFAFFENNSLCFSSLSEEKIRVVKQLFSFIGFNFNRDYVHKAEIIKALIYQLLFEVEPLYISTPSEVHSNSLSKESIVKKFKSLLAQKFKENRTVHFYAEELNISPKYLSQVLKEQTGKTANDWIDEMLVLEARVLLHDNNIRIQQIADSLNFPDQSTFGKYFKHHIGTSPLHYRQSLGLGVS